MVQLIIKEGKIKSHWQLGIPEPNDNFKLISWHVNPDLVDNEVPIPIKNILSKCLTDLAQVTFFSTIIEAKYSREWSKIGNDFYCSIHQKGFWNMLESWYNPNVNQSKIISTHQKEIVYELFEDAGFPWWYQSQVMLLTANKKVPPNITGKTLLTFLTQDWIEKANELSKKNEILAVIRPGVDGSVIGIWSKTKTFEEKYLKALKKQAEDTNVEFLYKDF